MQPGDVVAARYRVVRRAGSGGMATVYEAHDTVSGLSVALKTLRVELGRDARAQARMLREAHALSQIVHPAVVRYVDHGVTAGTPFLVMAWVAGETLADRLDRQGITVIEALRLVGRLAAGLSGAHAGGVVHRDLKPSNIMLAGGATDQAVIVDFGVARLAQSLSNVTVTGDQVGTPRYMAPEQIRSARGVDPKGDVFALGCVLFECLTGRAAFEGSDPVQVLARILFEPLPVPSALRAELPAAVDALTAQMMDRDVGRRLSARDVEVRIGQVLAGAQDFVRELRAPAASLADEEAPVSSTRVAPRPEFEELAGPPSFQLGANAVTTAARRVLPPQTGPLIGREDECQRLVELLASGQPIVAVWGGPGVGKTRLAIEAVQRVALRVDPPWDALVYADLTEARGADDVVRIVATEAGVSLEASALPEVALGRALDKLGRVLLVFDPIERVSVLLATLVRAFSRLAPALRVLATSRRRWTPPGAVAVELGPLSTSSSPGRPSPAARLLLEHVRRLAPPTPVASPEHDATLLQRAELLAAALEGVPLAIELAASSVALLGYGGVLARLSASPEPGAPTLETVQGPMKRVLEGSWALLNEAEQQALAQCAVFRGGFTVQAAEAVVRTSAPSSGLSLLQALRDHSLVSSRAMDAGEARLSMLAPVREFAWEKLQQSADGAGVLRRHAAYFASLDRSGPVRGSNTRISREAENLYAAAEFSIADDEADLATGLRALLVLESAFAVRWGAALGYVELLDRALAKVEAKAVDPATAALGLRILQLRARLDAPAGRLERARRDLGRCLRDAVDRGDPHLEGLVWLDLGVVAHLEREWAEARRCYEGAADRLRTHSDAFALGRCLGNLGALSHDEGDFDAAARLYRRSIALLEQVGEGRHRANLMGNLALLEQELGHPVEARQLYGAAVSLLEPIRDARLLAIVLGNSGVLELELGFAERAAEFHERCVGLLAGSGDVRSHALSLVRWAAALAVSGRAADAEVRLDQADGLVEPREPVVVEAAALARAFVDLSWAEQALAAGDRAGAERHREAARARVERAEVARSGDHLIRERSDDIRSALRILRRVLEALGQRLADGDR